MAEPDITSIGRYRVERLVGEGAMGVVYRALDPVLNRPVAVKVMTESLAREPEFRDRFLREAQSAGSLQHPNVITIYDFGETDGHLYIAMEFVTGDDLEHVLARQEPLTLARKLDIVIDVLNGLAYAHRHGVVHRDVKPANIRLTDDGRAKIMDFGIAHLASSDATRTGTLMGTPNYMAPEQVTAGRAVPASDIFSVGAVLYELLTGQKPFRGSSLHNILFRIVSEEPTPVYELVPALPPALSAIVHKALAKDLDRRYNDALTMANDLSEVRASLSDHPHTRTLSLRPSLERAIPRRVDGWRRPAGIVAALALLGVGAGGAVIALDRHRAESPRPVAPTALVEPPPAPAATDTTSSTPPAAAAPAAAPKPAVDERELALVRAMQRSAIATRTRAARKGATRALLAAGDSQMTAVEPLIARGRLADATAHITTAISRWAEAERTASSETVSVAAKPKLLPGSLPAPTPSGSVTVAPPPAAPAPVPTPPPAPAAVAETPAPVAAPAKPANASLEISQVVQAYARAIESRDVEAVRRAYPGLTTAQASGFEDFFRNVRSLTVSFAVQHLDVSGSSADARVAGSYDYVTSGGKAQNQSVSFAATLRHDPGGWTLVTVR